MTEFVCFNLKINESREEPSYEHPIHIMLSVERVNFRNSTSFSWSLRGNASLACSPSCPHLFLHIYLASLKSSGVTNRFKHHRPLSRLIEVHPLLHKPTAPMSAGWPSGGAGVVVVGAAVVVTVHARVSVFSQGLSASHPLRVHFAFLLCSV